MLNANTLITVGLSGGVDSAVSAYLLKQAGYQVNAIFMKNWEDDAEHCPAAEDYQDAKAVCELLQIDLELVNFASEYWANVFNFFLAEYQAGRTPNPDILCNKEIKFKAFLDYAKNRGANFIATGHYARRNWSEKSYQLLKSQDPEKDQTYFLYRLSAAQLANSLFPIGHLTKSEVRQIAAKIGLKNHAKKDSTGICFIGERRFKTFLNQYLPAKPGLIETLHGETIGEHDGLMFYTIGQRQGMRIGGKQGKLAAPWYVVAKDMARNVLVVVQECDHPALFKTTLHVKDLHWINNPPITDQTLTAKIRYRQAEQNCCLQIFKDKAAEVSFNLPQRAITPGQSIVFYQGDICLGGGIIEK